MSGFKFLGSKGTYPWTECDEINLDWFIDNFFSLSNFVKGESEDTKAMKRWILNGGVVQDVLVNGRSVLEKGIAKIDLGSIAVKVKDVFYEGVSVVNDKGIAIIPKLPEIIVKGVQSASGTNLVNEQGIAVIPVQECKVEDVKVNGASVVVNKSANINTVTRLRLSNLSVPVDSGGLAFVSPEGMGQVVADMELNSNQKAVLQNKLNIYPVTDAEGVYF